jgi:transcriptional regulator with XRE-family HTH domain
MSIYQIQKLLNTKNLDLQALSEKTGLSAESIQSFEQKTRENFDELQKISDALDMPALELLTTVLELPEIDSSKSSSIERFCALFPDAPGCKPSES